MWHPLSRFIIRTDDDIFNIKAGDAKKMISGKKKKVISETGVEYDANELLNKKVGNYQLDLFDSSLMKLITSKEQEETVGMKMGM